MTLPKSGFPDVQAVLVAALGAFPGVAGAGAETPADLAAGMPFVRVVRHGGASGQVNDSASVDVDVFTGTYAASEDLAERIRQYLVGPPSPAPLLDRVGCDIGPRELPWGDGVRRFNAAYTVVARRHHRWS